MENRKPALEPALRAEIARAGRRLGEHPSPETLVAYHERRLAGSEGERLRDHLALCADCAELLLDLAAFAEPETAAATADLHGPADVDVDAAWQSLRGRLGDGAAPSNVVRLPQASATPPPPTVAARSAVPPAVPPSPRQRRSPWTWALAASYLAVAGLGLWVFELRQENARLREPVVNAAITDLTASGDSTRGGGEPKEQALPADQGHVLILNVPDLPASAASYEAEIQADGPAGAVVWKAGKLLRSTDNTFTIDLPPGFLRPGRYQVRLYGSEGGKRQPLADFPLRIGAP